MCVWYYNYDNVCTYITNVLICDHPQREACRGYGYWVCHTLTTIEPPAILEPGGEGLNLVAARGMLQARDCLQKYVEREPGDGWALNLLGLLYEQEGLLVQAEKAFYK